MQPGWPAAIRGFYWKRSGACSRWVWNKSALSTHCECAAGLNPLEWQPLKENRAMSAMSIASTEEIVAELRAGRMVILVDEEDRENEGDIVLASDFVTPEAINFMAKHA